MAWLAWRRPSPRWPAPKDWKLTLDRLRYVKVADPLNPRESVRRMAPYSPPSQGRAGKLRLDFNENTVGCSPKVIDALLRETTKANANRHFYAIGHSFGARVLEGALEKSDYAAGIYDAIRNHPDQPYELPIDLVLLINPATESMKTQNFLKNLMNAGGSRFVVQHPGYADANCPNPKDRRCQPYPLMVEVSSVGDYLTAILMPVWWLRPSCSSCSLPSVISGRSWTTMAVTYTRCDIRWGS